MQNCSHYYQDSQSPPKPSTNYHSNVDTSRPFRSVKEAVAVFGERILVGEMYSLKPAYSGSYASAASSTSSYSKQEEIVTSCKLSSPSPKSTTRPNNNICEVEEEEEDKKVILDALKKIEAELEETKVELKLLKEREQETGEALAIMNVELQKNMSRLFGAEVATKPVIVATGEATKILTSDAKRCMKEQEEKRIELMKRMGENTTLAQILGLGKNDIYYGKKKKERKMLKKKPIVPLVVDFIFRKKGSSTNFNNSFYSSSQFYN